MLKGQQVWFWTIGTHMVLDLCFVEYLRVMFGTCVGAHLRTSASMTRNTMAEDVKANWTHASALCEIRCPVHVRIGFGTAWTIASAEHTAQGVLATTVVSCQ